MELETLSSDSSTLIHHHHRQNHRDTAATAVGVVQCEESGESSSSPPELELGLGLSLGCGNRIQKNNVQKPRIFTANQLNNNNNNNNSSSINNNNNNVSSNGGGVVVSPPSSASSSLALKTGDGGVCVGSKRAASPIAISQVVGWPPIRSYRMNSMAKSIANSENDAQFDETKGKKLIYDAENKGNAANSKEKSGHKSSLFVKVNMDGVAIGRKVDLASHSSYVSLARILEEMFTNNDDGEKANAEELILMPKVTRPSKLLDGTSDFVITYEDKDGDWMLVGDVPWGMFVTSVKRLKIMRTSEANGLAPRSEDRSSKQKRRPI